MSGLEDGPLSGRSTGDVGTAFHAVKVLPELQIYHP